MYTNGLLKTLLLIAAVCLASCGGGDKKTLTTNEQFKAAIAQYPDVAEYIFESNVALKLGPFVSEPHTIDGDNSGVHDLNDQQQKVLKESMRLRQCQKEGLAGCDQIECTRVNTNCAGCLSSALDCELQNLTCRALGGLGLQCTLKPRFPVW